MFSSHELIFAVPEKSVFEGTQGGFARRVLILALCETARKENLGFLDKVLAAARLNLQKDTLLAEIEENEAATFFPGLSEKQAEHILVFGLPPAQLGLTLEAPLYKPLPFLGSTWLFADALSVLAPDKAKKTQLWTALQQMFL